MAKGYVILTGAAGGIGQATAKVLCAENYNLICIVRNKEQANHLMQLFGKKVTCLIGDISSKHFLSECGDFFRKMSKENMIVGLVNCAGIANPSPISELFYENMEEMLKVNFYAPLLLTQMVVPIFREQKNGRVININSVEGYMTFPFVGGYSASKHALAAITSAMRMEFKVDNIKVISIVPGFVNTPIWDKAEKLSFLKFELNPLYSVLKNAKEKFIKIGRHGLPPIHVAKKIYQGLTEHNPKTDYIVVQNYFFEWFVMRILPERYREKLIKKYLDME